jgi:phage/plasmid-like protein (TIGR03299 family)
MSHELDETTGRAAMAYVGQEGTPWHGLGTPITEGMSPKEILKAASLTWLVRRKPVQFTGDDGQLKQDLEHQVLYRSDTNAVLDITGKGYVPSQNHEVMQFFQAYVEAGNMFIDTAGALDCGKRVWVLAKMDDTFKLPGNDHINGYVLLMNPHQYGKGMVGKMTAVRVVCHNTIMAALRGGGASIKVWHNREFTEQRQREAQEQLGIARERFAALKADAIKLAKTALEPADALEVFALVTGNDPKKPKDEQPPTVNRLMQLFEGAGLGAELVSAKGTAWGALNAVTQWVDHEYGRSQNARLHNAWLGRGDIMKREALELLLQRN